MTKAQVAKLRHGLYRIHWKSGGESLASVGSTNNGLRWLAPTNWTGATDATLPGAWKTTNGGAWGPASFWHWRQVRSVTPIIVQMPGGVELAAAGVGR